MANATVTTIRIRTKYFALIKNGNGISMISFSPNTRPKAIRMAKTPPEAPTVTVREERLETDLRLPEESGSSCKKGQSGSGPFCSRSEEHTSELQSLRHLVC